MPRNCIEGTGEGDKQMVQKAVNLLHTKLISKTVYQEKHGDIALDKCQYEDHERGGQ